MFLLQRRGPTSFVVKDSALGMKSTVQIGSTQTCTCQRKQPDAGCNGVCAHIVFVMIKVLQIPAQTPVVWQASLTGTHERPICFAYKSDPCARPLQFTSIGA